MNVLALDLATKTGWALSENGTITSGVQSFELKKGDSAGMRYLRLTRWLEEVAVKTNLIVFEMQHNRGGHTTEIANGLVTHVQAFCALHKIEHTAIHSMTLKKFTTGSGKADKAAMIAAVRKKWKADVLTDDEADAVALLHYAREEIVGR